MHFLGSNLFILIAQLGSNDVLNEGQAASQTVVNAWNDRWSLVMTGNLYKIMAQMAIFFAVVTLIFYMLQWLRDLLEENYARPLSALIWPFIVVLLLNEFGSTGIPLANLTLGLRGYVSGINQEVLLKSGDNSSGQREDFLREDYKQAIDRATVEEVVGSLLRPCQSLIGQQQIACLLEARQEINNLFCSYVDPTISPGSNCDAQMPPWMRQLNDRLDALLPDVGSNDSQFPDIQIPQFEFNALLGSNSQAETKTFLLSSQYAFQNLIEVGMLLIAALGPLALGLSLLPVGGKPIYAWLTGFFAFGIAKLSFSIIAGLTAGIFVNTASSDSLWFLIFNAFLAPIFAIGISIAFGWSVFIAISNAASWVVVRT